MSLVCELPRSYFDRVRCNAENIHRSVAGMTREEHDYGVELADEYLARCETLFEPRGGYAIVDDIRFSDGRDSMQAGGEVFAIGIRMGSFLEYSQSIAVFAGTCGGAIDDLAKRLMKRGDAIGSYIVDRIGTQFAIAVAEVIHSAVESEAEKLNWRTTDRYSPGHCFWPVSEQAKLFALLNGNSFGIQLTSSSFMIPEKSISGVVGLGTGVRKLGYVCNVCPESACLHRDAAV
jgi:hypothetical protein